MSSATSRRSVLRGVAAVGVAGVAGFVVARSSSAADDTAGAAANAYGAAAPAGGGSPIARLTDVPDGGGLVLDDTEVVLTRDGDTVRGFSSTCTHQGYTVSEVTGGKILCPCRGSAFDAATGNVVTGPATQPLPVVDIDVRGGSVYRTGGS